MTSMSLALPSELDVAILDCFERLIFIETTERMERLDLTCHLHQLCSDFSYVDIELLVDGEQYLVVSDRF